MRERAASSEYDNRDLLTEPTMFSANTDRLPPLHYPRYQRKGREGEKETEDIEDRKGREENNGGK